MSSRPNNPGSVIRRLAAPLIWLRRRLRPHKVPVMRAEGPVAGGEHPLIMLCGAKQQDQAYLLELAFQKAVPQTELGPVALHRAYHPAYGKNAGLVILETNPSLHAWLDDGSWFFIPAWVWGETKLPLTDAVRRSDTFRSIGRRNRKHGFEFEVTRDEERFKDFYHHMHVPYVTKIYGPKSYCRTYDEMWAQLGSFDLVLIRKQSQPGLALAGFFILYEPTGPRFWALGVRDGNEDYVSDGVIASLYLFCFDYFAQKGFNRVYMGGSRPFLRDGVLRSKKKLMQELLSRSWQGFALKVVSLTPATRLFLVNNPFIFIAKDRLHGAVFTEAPLTVETVCRLDHDFFHPGMSRLLLYFFEETGGFQVASLPPEVAARVEIRAADQAVSGHLNLV